MDTKENIEKLKKLNRQINEIISELKKDCLNITVKQHPSDKIELSVFLKESYEPKESTFCKNNTRCINQ